MIIDNVVIGQEKHSLSIENGRISAVLPPGQQDTGDCGYFDASGLTAIPGLIDIHTHGRMGLDTGDGDFAALMKEYAKAGTTSVLATTMTEPFDKLVRTDKAACEYIEAPSEGANLLGLHFEGPYISPEKRGAQDAECIRKASAEEFGSLASARMVTVAPETEGCMEFIKEVSDNTLVSLGHTACTEEEAEKAIDAGAVCLTHIYNAMSPFRHRDAGPIGAAFTKQIYVQLICDGRHVCKSVVLATFRLFPGKVVLISDSIRPAGLSSGEFSCGGLEVILKDGKACLKDGTFAGSTASLLDCVKKAAEFGIPFEEAVDAASRIPAEMLGLNKGRLENGYDADLLLLDENKELKHVMIGGKFFDIYG